MATVTYRIIRCPHCNKKLAKRRMGTKYPGSPFRSCPNCGEEYLDRDYHEPAIEGIRPDTDYRGHLVFAPLSFVIGYVMREGYPVFFGFCVIFTIFFGIIGIIGLVGHLSGADKRKCDQLLEASKNRLQNPAYALKLKSAGYSIPPEYDPTAQVTPRPATPAREATNNMAQGQPVNGQERAFCRKCGAKIPQGAESCPMCGTKRQMRPM